MIKSKVVSTPERAERNYPYIGMSATSVVVLFVRPNTGFVLRSPVMDKRAIGSHDSTWSEHYFVPLEGYIQLSNDNDSRS